MVRVRRANQGTRRTPSIRETSRRIRRNSNTRRLPYIIVSLNNDTIISTPEIIDLEPTPSTINQSSPSIQEIIEIDLSTSSDLGSPQPNSR